MTGPDVESLQSVVGTIQYVARSEPGPRVYYSDVPPGVPRSTLVRDPHPMAVHDVRGAEDRFSWTRDGIMFLSHSPPLEDADDDTVRARVYPHLEAYAREVLGSDRVGIQSHAIRARQYAQVDGRRTDGAHRTIADFAHADESPGSAERMVRSTIPAWNGEPFSITKFWSPLLGPLYDNPLTLCVNGRADDFQPIENVYSFGPEILPGLAYRPHHRWVYWSGMQPGEVLAFRSWNSRMTPDDVIGHVAFALPEVPADALPRHSFEFKVVAIHA